MEIFAIFKMGLGVKSKFKKELKKKREKLKEENAYNLKSEIVQSVYILRDHVSRELH